MQTEMDLERTFMELDIVYAQFQKTESLLNTYAKFNYIYKDQWKGLSPAYLLGCEHYMGENLPPFMFKFLLSLLILMEETMSVD